MDQHTPPTLAEVQGTLDEPRQSAARARGASTRDPGVGGEHGR